MTLKQFDVHIQDKIGEVARIAEVLAKKAVNIRGIATDLGQGNPVIHIITDDDASARSALNSAGIPFSEKEIIVMAVLDKPGELQKMTKKLARGGVNIESLFILGAQTPIEELAFSVDKMDKAKEILDYS
ncbi:MAG: hypothetical protein A4E32_00249 [Methanomassiliicoccales archaeon PtaU1.Bin124]|nr:MAG: hypothetical protein A4E32_00249 [Methanomassiliicoccales archaeon PtaU1.Bin124]